MTKGQMRSRSPSSICKSSASAPVAGELALLLHKHSVEVCAGWLGSEAAAEFSRVPR